MKGVKTSLILLKVYGGSIDLQELRQKAHTQLARLQPWDEWRLPGKNILQLESHTDTMCL